MGQGRSISPPTDNIVALLDVDHTLLFDDEIVNQNLIKSLLKYKINNIFLFTDMTFNTHAITERNWLISKLEEQGFIVQGVVTPNDLSWMKMDKEEVTILHNLCFSSITEREYTGPLYGEEFENFILSRSDQLPNLAEAICRYKPPNEVIIGMAYKLVCEELDSFGTVPPSTTMKSTFSKAFTDHLSEKHGYLHNKGLLLDLFIRQKPEWIESILVFDDNKQVIKDVTTFKMVEHVQTEEKNPDEGVLMKNQFEESTTSTTFTTLQPVVTMIAVEGHDMDMLYYADSISKHLNKVAR